MLSLGGLSVERDWLFWLLLVDVVADGPQFPATHPRAKTSISLRMAFSTLVKFLHGYYANGPLVLTSILLLLTPSRLGFR